MNKKSILGVCVVYAFIFVLLFYKKSIGINLFIFECLAIPAMLYFYRPLKKNILFFTLLCATIASLIAVVLIHSTWSIIVNSILFLSLTGILTYPGQRSFFHNSIASIVKIFSAQWILFSKKDWQKKDNNEKKQKINSRRVLFWALFPILITILFIILYTAASSAFAAKLSPVFTKISELLSQIDFSIFFFFILGLFVCHILFIKTPLIEITKRELAASDTLERKSRKQHLGFIRRISGNEFKIKYFSGIITLGLLNLLILFFNIIDINTIWIHYQWDGRFLKEFVHEGTWLLIFAVLFSGSIALFFFKGQINFYSKNKALKVLTLLWLLQNCIMVVSVFIRNYWYMYYFGLAYKRIAVFFFLGLTITGLITIVSKIILKKSNYYLLRVNSYVLLLTLLISCFFQWNTIIARHNFKHVDRSLIDLKFMYTLGDEALPFTYKTPQELKRIEERQIAALPFSIRQPYLWDKEQYWKNMAKRPGKFMSRYDNFSWLEWNFADYHAYKKLEKLLTTDAP